MKRKDSSGSSESSEVEQSSASQSSVETTSSSSSSESSEKELGSGSEKKKRKKARTIWNRLKDIWAMEARPEHMRHRRGIANMSLGEIIKYKEHFEKEAEKRGVGEAIFGRDQRLRSKQFPAQKDHAVPQQPGGRVARRVFLLLERVGQPLPAPPQLWLRPSFLSSSDRTRDFGTAGGQRIRRIMP